MKKFIIVLPLFCLLLKAQGQTYYVTYIKGNVYFHHKLLKMRDKVEGKDAITSDDRSAELALFNIQKGEYRLTFQKSTPQQVKSQEKHSELYTLIIQNYLDNYTTQGTLSSRGEFDLQKFFNYRDTGNRVLLIKGQTLPKNSKKLKILPGDKFFICLTDKDATCFPIANTNDSLSFSAAVLSGFSAKAKECRIKLSYLDNGVGREEYFPRPVYISSLNREDIKKIVGIYFEGLADYFQNDRNKLSDAIKSHIQNYYGNFYEPEIDQLIALSSKK